MERTLLCIHLRLRLLCCIILMLAEATQRISYIPLLLLLFTTSIRLLCITLMLAKATQRHLCIPLLLLCIIILIIIINFILFSPLCTILMPAGLRTLTSAPSVRFTTMWYFSLNLGVPRLAALAQPALPERLRRLLGDGRLGGE